MSPADAGEDDDEGNRRARLLVLLVLVAMIFGAGIGTIAENGFEFTGGSQPTIEVSTPTTPGGPETPSRPGQPGGTPAGPTDESTGPGEGTPRGPGEGDGEGDADDSVGPRLAIEGNTVSVTYSTVKPGDSATDAIVVVRNVGDRPGRVHVAPPSVTEAENGIQEPEAVFDDSPADGELADHLRVALYAEHGNGTAVPLLGTATRARSLAAIGNETARAHAGVLSPGDSLTIVVEWELPRSTGNVVQSDSATLDLSVTVEAVSAQQPP